MAAQVMQPKKKFGSSASDLLQLGGAVAGGFASGGSPAGILGGAQLGGAVGGMVGDSGGSAVERRMAGAQIPQQTVAAPQPQEIAQIDAARMALASQPPEIQQQYGPTLQMAALKARRGMA